MLFGTICVRMFVTQHGTKKCLFQVIFSQCAMWDYVVTIFRHLKRHKETVAFKNVGCRTLYFMKIKLN